jgi:probable rRNA maturation factor
MTEIDAVAIDIEVADPDWTRVLPDAVALAALAARRALAEAAVADSGEVAILLTDDTALAAMNERFRGKAGPTNVLSFPSAVGPGGDVALAFGTCAREAAEQGKAVAPHLQHLTAHGVLHLYGFDHQNAADADAMEALERRIMSALGVPDPYAADG